MLNWKDYYTQEQIRQERLKEAKQERIIRLLSRNIRVERKKTREELLRGLGYRLIAWGDALLKRAERYPAGYSNINSL